VSSTRLATAIEHEAFGIGICGRGNRLVQTPGELGHQPSQICITIGHVGGQDPLGHPIHEMGEGFDPRLVRDAEVLVTAAVDDDGSPLCRSEAKRAASVVFPIPGSPAKSTDRRRPSPSTVFQTSSNRSDSVLRPTKVSDRAASRRTGNGGLSSIGSTGVQRTRLVSTGWSSPFRSRGPTDSKTSPLRVPAR